MFDSIYATTYEVQLYSRDVMEIGPCHGLAALPKQIAVVLALPVFRTPRRHPFDSLSNLTYCLWFYCSGPARAVLQQRW